MRKVRWMAYGGIALFLYTVFHVSDPFVQSSRSFCIGSLAPAWETCCYLAWKLRGIGHPQDQGEKSQEELHRLRRENAALIEERDALLAWVMQEKLLEKKIAQYLQQDIQQRQHRKEQLLSRLKMQMQAVPARVTYREPCQWSSFLWVNVGEKTNRDLGKQVIAKNSPVVVGDIIVGVVEEVRQGKSKVRLITDRALCVAVRVIREKKSNDTVEDTYLAKGLLQGTSAPLWRCKSTILRGIGFNYDCPDDEGGGASIYSQDLICHGDVLVTSGLDGVFPPGFVVATVTEIEPLREGACAYSINARLLLQDFHEIKSVFVLPPLEDF